MYRAKNSGSSYVYLDVARIREGRLQALDPADLASLGPTQPMLNVR
jgi:hypothetical protein